MVRYSALPPDLRHWTKLSLARYGLTAGQKMGQHFLVDPGVLRDIITAAQLSDQSRVLEVGGGLGVLTLELLTRSQRVVVVELDQKLAEALGKIGITSSSLKVIKGDVLKVPSSLLKEELGATGSYDWQIVANLPYEITGAFLQRFLWGDFVPQSLTLLLQREVAERIVAEKGKMSLLSLNCQLKSKIKIIRPIPPQSFWPPPQVQSSLVRLDLLSKQAQAELLSGQSEELLWRLARIGFSSRRRVLINNLASGLSLPKAMLEQSLRQASIALLARAQELTINDWVALTKQLVPKI